jgi:NAD(P)-dependent dehydrogenase (short-subunit alcohol dehydrogenase family)
MEIAGKAFLISGGGSGLGAATARRLVAEGGNVVLADVNPAVGEPLAAALGAAARFVRTDVTSAADVQQAVETAVAAFGALHGAVNCAGIAVAEKVLGKRGVHALDAFARVIQINLIGTFNVIRLAAAAIARPSARIAGTAGLIGRLGVDAQQRLGAGEAHQQPAAVIHHKLVAVGRDQIDHA